MPDYFSHSIAAELIYQNLDGEYKKRLSKTLYLLGAQGGDIFFAYNLSAKNNLGRALHRQSPELLFEKLLHGNLSFAAGFATHYALDSTLHPLVYSYEKKRRSPFAHTSFESDLGLYISRKFKMRRQIMQKDIILACTGEVYDSIRKVEPLITITGIERCLKRHFVWSVYAYKVKRLEYKCNYDFAAANDKIDEAIALGERAVKGVFSGSVDRDIFYKDFLSK